MLLLVEFCASFLPCLHLLWSFMCQCPTWLSVLANVFLTFIIIHLLPDPSSRMERPAFSRYLQMQNPDGKDTTFPDACPSLKTSQSRATMKGPMPGVDLRFYHSSIRPAGLPLGSDVSSAFHPIHDLQIDNSPRELTLPVAQEATWEACSPSQTQQNSSVHKKCLPAFVNNVTSESYVWSMQSKSKARVQSLACEFQETDSPVMKIKVCKYYSPPTPWQLGQKEEPTQNSALEFYQWMTTLQPRPAITAPWLMHFKPKFIELAPDDIHGQITAQAEFDVDFMDICIRRIKQMDGALYGAHVDSRWRHLMESDFMIFFQAIVNQRCFFYVWDLGENEVMVYDPSMLRDM
ncbi:uncharacterized protein LOC111257874 isoform X2 [Setaria italica]|uniref:uncharacterized protein LOC111257874 isoform X2 n=1 Tax=Setaria italica TaxID=4555 RepID=UPI000BE4C7EF|nr:uncharacterized protein LOC111257874 isoform X2 [Setaria italica]